MLTTCLFNIFLPTADWEIKPYREYKGKGLLEQVDVLPIKVGDKTYYMHYKDWKAVREWRRKNDPFYWL